jgi:hypothetical protein
MISALKNVPFEDEIDPNQDNWRVPASIPISSESFTIQYDSP